jgi:hypothetical protein
MPGRLREVWGLLVPLPVALRHRRHVVRQDLPNRRWQRGQQGGARAHGRFTSSRAGRLCCPRRPWVGRQAQLHSIEQHQTKKRTTNSDDGNKTIKTAPYPHVHFVPVTRSQISTHANTHMFSCYHRPLYEQDIRCGMQPGQYPTDYAFHW